MRFEPGNYVMFKHLEEWQEGRVLGEVSGHADDEKKCYRILSFKTYSEVPSLVSENIVPSSLENARKLKVAPLCDCFSTGHVHIPTDLYEIVRNNVVSAENGVMPSVPGKVTVSAILRDFGEFIIANKPAILLEEVDEMLAGFTHAFNALAPSILTAKEAPLLSRINENAPVDILGAEYLLRVALFLEMKVLPTIKDGETRGVVFDYLTYLLDYLNLARSKYLNLN